MGGRRLSLCKVRSYLEVAKCRLAQLYMGTGAASLLGGGNHPALNPEQLHVYKSNDQATAPCSYRGRGSSTGPRQSARAGAPWRRAAGEDRQVSRERADFSAFCTFLS